MVITGLGPVTSAGAGCDAMWHALRGGRVNVSARSLLVDVGRTADLAIAAMPPDDQVPGLARHTAFLAEQEAPGYRDLAYALLAIELALKDAGLLPGDIVDAVCDAAAGPAGRIGDSIAESRIGLIQAFEAPGVERTVSTLFAMMSAAMGAGGPPPASAAGLPSSSAPAPARPPAPGPSASGHAAFAQSALGPSASRPAPGAPPSGPPPVYEFLSPFFYNMQPFVYVHLAGKAFGLRGFSTSVHNACASGAFAIELAAERIRSGQADAMLVAGGEAFDTGVRLEWFRRLNLYAKSAADCRPFDETSGGFFVGEGAGAILLESKAHAEARGAQVYAEYIAGAFAHQAWKQTVPDVRSGRLAVCIADAFRRANLNPAEVDLIVPHGAATTISDGYEAECLARAFQAMASCDSRQSLDDGMRRVRGVCNAGETPVPHRSPSASAAAREAGPASGPVITAFKPYVGHMLAGSAIIDTICGLLAMRHGYIPPLPKCRAAESRLPCPVITEGLTLRVRTLLKLSTGFTGHDAALLFSACK